MFRTQFLAQAKQIDSRIATGQDLHILAGIPLAIKDNICHQDLSTTACSNLLRAHQSSYDAEVVTVLKGCGSVLIGKTNMDEFGMGSTTETSANKATHNPWDLSRVPGGSSGGSAAAVAGQMCAGALGSDTGGSIRQPAAFCGVVGLKPTYGAISRHGLIAYCSTFDTIGPIGPTVQDVSYIFGALQKDGNIKKMRDTSLRHSSIIETSLPPQASLSCRPYEGRRFAVIAEAIDEGVADEVKFSFFDSVRHIESLGGVVDLVSCKTFQMGLPAYYVMAVSEASSNLARFDGVRVGNREASYESVTDSLVGHFRHSYLGPEVLRRILMGTYTLSSGYSDEYYARAKYAQRLVRDELISYLSQYDALLTPATPDVAYTRGSKIMDPLQMYTGDLMTVNVNLSGLPAIVVRSGVLTVAEGTHLPIGLQFIGKHFGEGELLQIAHIFEISLDSVTKFPDEEIFSWL